MIVFFNVTSCLSGSIKYIILLVFTVLTLYSTEQVLCQKSNIDSIQLLLKQDMHDTVRINLYIKLLNVYSQSNSRTVEPYADKLLELSKSINSKKGLKIANRAKGFFAELKGDYYNSTDYYLSWLEISKQHHDSSSILDAYMSLAYIKTLIKEYDLSLEYSYKSLNLSQQLRDLYIWNIYNNIGLVFKQMNQLDSAIYYYSKSKEFSLKQSSEQGLVYSMGNLAEILIMNGKYNEALNSFDSVLNLAIKNNDYASLSVLFSNKSYIYVQLSRQTNIDKGARNNYKNLAIETAEKALSYAKKNNYLEHKNNAYKQLLISYKEKKIYDKAIYYAGKTIQAQDKLFNSEKASAVKREKYKNQMLISKRDKINQANTIKKQNLIMKIAIIASIVIVSLFVLLVIIYIKQRRQHKLVLKVNKDLAQKSAEITKKEEILRKVNLELSAANNMKNQFFSILAHDLKTPFDTMIRFSELINFHAKAGKYNEVSEYVNVLTETSKSTFYLLENLLTWSQLQRNLIKYKPKILNVNKIITDVERDLKQFLTSKNITLINKVKKDATVYADSYMISTIIRNLVYNSIKFTNQGGEISISANYYGDYKINIVVADTGLGITKSKLQNLFDSNIQSSLGTENEKGSGIGLMICKEFANINGGNLSIKSIVGEGTSVTISLLNNKP